MKAHRLARVNEVVRETAATAILFELKDPRVKNVTVTRAEVSADLQHAKVFVSVMGTEREQQLTMHGLKSAAGFVQKKVGDQLTTRYVPHITFVLDEGVKKSIEIARLIREAQGEPPPATADEADAADEAEETDEPETDAAEPPPADAATRPAQPGAADGPATTPG
jgi:ribosome-binding factor A